MQNLSLEQVLKYTPDLLDVDDFLKQILNKVTYDEFISEILLYPNVYEKISTKQLFWKNFLTETLNYNKDKPVTNWFNEFLGYANPIKEYYLASYVSSALTKLIPDFVYEDTGLYIVSNNKLPFDNIKDVKIIVRNSIVDYYILLENGDVLHVYPQFITNSEGNYPDFTSKIETFATNVKNIETILYRDNIEVEQKFGSEIVRVTKLMNYFVIVLLTKDNKILFYNDESNPHNEQRRQNFNSPLVQQIRNENPNILDIKYDNIQLVCRFGDSIDEMYYNNETYFAAKFNNTLYIMKYHKELVNFSCKFLIYPRNDKILSYQIIRPGRSYDNLIIFIINGNEQLFIYKTRASNNDRLQLDVEEVNLANMLNVRNQNEDNIIPDHLKQNLKSVESIRTWDGEDIYIVFKTNKKQAYLYSLEDERLYDKNDYNVASIEFFAPRNRGRSYLFAIDSYGIIYRPDYDEDENGNIYRIDSLSRNMSSRIIMPEQYNHYGIIYETYIESDEIIYPYAIFLLQSLNKQVINEIFDLQYIYFELIGSPYKYYTIRP